METREKILGLKREYGSIEELIRKNPTEETEKAKELFKRYKIIQKKGAFTKDLLFEIAYWKSQRKAYLCKINTKRVIIRTLNKISEINDERDKIKHLINNLWGVGVPVASAILTIIDPKNYGLIDYKVWQILYLYEQLDNKPKGRNLSVKDWLQYLELIHKLAQSLNVSARTIDRTLFEYHKKLKEFCTKD